MDPVSILGLVASVAQLGEQALRLLVKTDNYFSAVKKAPARAKDLQEELHTISAILSTLTQALLKSHVKDFIAVHSLERIIAGFGKELDKLEKRSRLDSTHLIRRVLWPLGHVEIDKILSTIERYKTLFLLVLSIQQR